MKRDESKNRRDIRMIILYYVYNSNTDRWLQNDGTYGSFWGAEEFTDKNNALGACDDNPDLFCFGWVQ